MSADAFVRQWARPARLRSGANTLAIGIPLALAAAAIGWRTLGTSAALLILLVGLAAVALIAALRSRRYDRQWLVRQLDTSRPDMEDSADLLFANDAGLNPLQVLQRARLQSRLESASASALRPGWQTHKIIAAWLAAAAIIAAALLWPDHQGNAPMSFTPAAIPAGPPKLTTASLEITPPAYTGLPRRSTGLDARAPVGSRLTWAIRFAPQPQSADLVLVGGRRIPLSRSGQAWTATRSLGQSLLYRVVPAGDTAPMPLHRIDAIPDAPPVVRALTPETTLTLMTKGQRNWPLLFEVTDDHGVAPTAQLRLIVTSGEGENISFKESTRTLGSSGEPRRRRFAASLDIAALALTAGNDIVAQLIVADNRSPGPQTVRSASLILRWPADLGKEAGGLDGMVKTVLPAYFRSQRQIIIDAEALLKQRRSLSRDEFVSRSDAIGVDQRLLRMRYGGLLGDEAAKEAVLPTSDDAPKADPDGDNHGPAKAQVFGNAGDVLSEYGHTHDEAGVATLFDPETRAVLRAAVDAMWQSELSLRQGAPDAALPHAYQALALIKKVQQATRIYLARTGAELPPIDLGRRLTGDRKGLGAPAFAPPPRESGDTDAIPAAAWRGLAAPGAANLDLAGLQRWAASSGRVADPLALAAAIDAVAADPACSACRDRLRGQLWLALAPPPAQVGRRPAPDAAGQRYLDALR